MSHNKILASFLALTLVILGCVALIYVISNRIEDMSVQGGLTNLQAAQVRGISRQVYEKMKSDEIAAASKAAQMKLTPTPTKKLAPPLQAQRMPSVTPAK